MDNEIEKKLRDLADRAIDVLRDEPKEIVDICGPLTTSGFGYETNLKVFEYAKEVLENKGYYVFDSFAYEAAIKEIRESTGGDDHFDEALEFFWGPIYDSKIINKVFFLPNWKESKGAIWEHDRLTKLGVEIEEIPKEWLSKYF